MRGGRAEKKPTYSWVKKSSLNHEIQHDQQKQALPIVSSNVQSPESDTRNTLSSLGSIITLKPPGLENVDVDTGVLNSVQSSGESDIDSNCINDNSSSETLVHDHTVGVTKGKEADKERWRRLLELRTLGF